MALKRKSESRDSLETLDREWSMEATRSSDVSATRSRRVFRNQTYEIPDTSFCAKYRNAVADVLETTAFDTGIAFVILANAVTIGLESSARVHGLSEQTLALSVLENGFLVVYLAEFSLRFFTFGWRCLRDGWVRFDAFLVVIGILSNWVVPVWYGQDANLGPLVVLRLLRILRIARTLKLLVRMKYLWLLVRSFIDSSSMMGYTIMMLAVVIYIFACIGVELITLSPSAQGHDADPAFRELAENHFPTLGMTMLTLTQFVSLDSISDIYTPLILLDPYKPLLLIYFTLAVVIIGIILMNLITAVVVNSSLEQASKDREAKQVHEEADRKHVIKRLQKIFKRLDEDSSGDVTMAEIHSMCDEDKEQLQRVVDVCNPEELFSVLDVNGDGKLRIDEFCLGIWQVSQSQVPLELKRTEKQVSVLRDQVSEMFVILKELQAASLQMLAAQCSNASGSKLASALPVTLGESMETLKKRLQEEMRNQLLGVPVAMDTRTRTGPIQDASSFEAAEVPAWAHMVLLELKQLRLECLPPAESCSSCSLRFSSSSGRRPPRDVAPCSSEKLPSTVFEKQSIDQQHVAVDEPPISPHVQRAGRLGWRQL